MISRFWIGIIAVFILMLPQAFDCGVARPGAFFYSGLYAGDFSESKGNYYTLVELYTKWNDGLFGSRKFHEYFLKKFLNKLIDREIETDFDYFLVSPEDMFGKRVECKFDSCRWLYFFGDFDGESVAKILKENPGLLNNWWRSDKLVSVSGKVRKYRLNRDHMGDIIELYLYKITLRAQ